MEQRSHTPELSFMSLTAKFLKSMGKSNWLHSFWKQLKFNDNITLQATYNMKFISSTE